MKKGTKFSVGDKVFAKVKGYPAWPAIITDAQSTKYNVKFYGTGETGSVKAKDLFYYLKFKKTFVKNLKRKDYNEAIEEIEKAIELSGTDGNNDTDATGESAIPEINESVDSTKSNKRKRNSTSEKIINSKRKNVSSSVSADENSTDDNSKSTEPQLSPFDSEDANEVIKTHVAKNATEKSATAHDKFEKKLKEMQASNEVNGAKTDISDNDATTNEDTLKLKIITLPYLQALASYAQHVRNNNEVYLKMPAISRSNFFNEVVLAKLPDDHYVCLKFNRTCPKNFKNEYQQVEHDEGESEKVLGKKKSIEDGTLKPEDDPDSFEPDVTLNNEQIEHMLEMDLVNRKKAKLKLLKRESTLIGLDAKIKASLGLDKADPKNALEHLSKMAEMAIEPLMLKKHPHIVDMVKRLRRYIGNVKEWEMNEEQQEQFEIEAENVREKAEEVYVNFAKLFGVTDTSEFWDVFSKEVETFKEHVIDLKESEMFTLTAEPNSREAFLEKIDDENEMQIDLGKLDKNNATSEKSS